MIESQKSDIERNKLIEDSKRVGINETIKQYEKITQHHIKTQLIFIFALLAFKYTGIIKQCYHNVSSAGKMLKKTFIKMCSV